jgi:hypothetical protein
MRIRRAGVAVALGGLLSLGGVAVPALAPRASALLTGCYVADNQIVQIGNQFAAHVLVNCAQQSTGAGTITLTPQLGLGVEAVGYGVIFGYSGYVATATYASGVLTRCFSDSAVINVAGQTLTSSKTQCF